MASARLEMSLTVLGWLAVGTPGGAYAETFAVTLAGADDAVPAAATFHCSSGGVEQPVLRAPSGTMVGPVVVTVAREVGAPMASPEDQGDGGKGI